MKKTVFAAHALVCGMLMLGSCSNGDSPISQSYGLTLGVVMCETGTGSTTASPATFNFNYDLTNSQMELRVSDLTIDGASYSFKTAQPVPFKEVGFGNVGTQTSIDIPSMPSNNTAMTMTDVNGIVYTLYKYNPILGVMSQVWRHFDLSFNVGGYKAQVFEPNSYFSGSTTATFVYNDQHMEFATSKPIYMVSMDLEKNKAEVWIYQAQFAQQMPAINLMKLRGLDITFADGNYTLSGKDIKPMVVEGNAETPNETFVFNDFTFRTISDKLDEADISFTVAERYHAIARVKYVM